MECTFLQTRRCYRSFLILSLCLSHALSFIPLFPFYISTDFSFFILYAFISVYLFLPLLSISLSMYFAALSFFSSSFPFYFSSLLHFSLSSVTSIAVSWFIFDSSIFASLFKIYLRLPFYQLPSFPFYSVFIVFPWMFHIHPLMNHLRHHPSRKWDTNQEEIACFPVLQPLPPRKREAEEIPVIHQGKKMGQWHPQKRTLTDLC
jgi:hypothetical protein